MMKNVLSLLLLIIMSACYTASPIIKIEPKNSENTFYNHGALVKKFNTSNLEVFAQFVDFSRDDLIFHISVNNHGSDTIEINPLNCKIQFGEDTLTPLAPEAHLLKNQISASKRERNLKNANLIEGVVGIATTTASTIAVMKGVPVDVSSDPIFIDRGPTTFFNDAPEVQFWKTQVLRRTTLFPQSQTDGLVLFPRADEMREFVLIIPVQSEIIRFHFKQRLFKSQ